MSQQVGALAALPDLSSVPRFLQDLSLVPSTYVKQLTTTSNRTPPPGIPGTCTYAARTHTNKNNK